MLCCVVLCCVVLCCVVLCCVLVCWCVLCWCVVCVVCTHSPSTRHRTQSHLGTATHLCHYAPATQHNTTQQYSTVQGSVQQHNSTTTQQYNTITTQQYTTVQHNSTPTQQYHTITTQQYNTTIQQHNHTTQDMIIARTQHTPVLDSAVTVLYCTVLSYPALPVPCVCVVLFVCVHACAIEEVIQPLPWRVKNMCSMCSVEQCGHACMCVTTCVCVRAKVDGWMDVGAREKAQHSTAQHTIASAAQRVECGVHLSRTCQ